MSMRYKVISILLVFISLQPVMAVEQIELILGHIKYNNIIVDNAVIKLDYGAGQNISFHITASRLTLYDVGDFEKLKIDCKSGSMTASLFQCHGGVFNVNHKDLGEIHGHIDFVCQLDGSNGQVKISGIAAGAGEITGYAAFNSSGWQATLQGNHLDLAWLRKTIEPYGIWPSDYSEESGSVDVDVHINSSQSNIDHIQGNIQAYNVGFYGINAAEDFSGKMNFDIDAKNGWRIKAEGNLDSGALFVETGIVVGNLHPGIALELTDQPLRFVLDTKLDDSLQQFNIHQLDIEQTGVMTAHIQADTGLGEAINIRNADISLSATDTGKFYATWLQPFLLETQFNAMETAGALEAGLHIRDNELTHLDLLFNDVHAYDSNNRFHIAGLDGSLRINEKATPVSSTLSWNGAGIYRLDIGAGKLALESSNQEIEIVSWEDVPILGGKLHIDALNITNAGKPDMTVSLDGALTPIAMADFTRAMNLPIMSGELTGTIEGLTYSHGNLVVNGRIYIGLFDGNVVIRDLSIEDLFGLLPELHADIDIQSLDLELLTNRFSFGYIQGHLSGKIHNLELQAWQPVYFEAELMTPKDDESRHRISQQAVDNLGYIGGGAINALSNGFLGLFKEYSYGQLGISCRLFNDVCQLGGVSETEDGFIIVSRGGLLPPWIEVKGTGHSIAWPVLVEGLKTITTNKPEFK